MIIKIALNGFKTLGPIIINEIQKRPNMKITIINDFYLKNNKIINIFKKKYPYKLLANNIELINNFLIINGEIIFIYHYYNFYNIDNNILQNIDFILDINNLFFFDINNNNNYFKIIIINPKILLIKKYPIYLLNINHKNYKNENCFYGGYYIFNEIAIIINKINKCFKLKYIKIYLCKKINKQNIYNFFKYIFIKLKIKIFFLKKNIYKNNEINLFLIFKNKYNYFKLFTYIKSIFKNNILYNIFKINKNKIIISLFLNNNIFFINKILNIISFIYKNN